MFYSVRARLTLWYSAILAVVLITFSAISYALLARAIRSATDSSLAATAREFTAAFANDVDRAFAGRTVPLDFRYSERDILVFAPSGSLVASSRLHLTSDEQRRLANAARGGAIGFVTIEGGVDRDGVRAYVAPIRVVGTQYMVFVAQDLDEQADRLYNHARPLDLGSPLALLAAAAGGYVMPRKSLAPVSTMSIKARQISAETLGERIAVGNERDELGFLAVTLNELLERLQRAFESQRRFMADASHELRTPVSIIQGEADVALARRDRSPDDYRESIEIMQNAARKLTRIVQDLFLLARTDAGSYPIAKSRFYLDETLADCVRAMRSAAASKSIDLVCNAPPDSIVCADEELIQRMLINLIENAVKFTRARGHVTVIAEAQSDAYAIRVTDTGPGIAAEDQEHVFERFFRVDRVRRRNAPAVPTTGAGLGLPIARWIAEAHDGELSIERSDESGTTFLVMLPQDAGAASSELQTTAAQRA